VIAAGPVTMNKALKMINKRKNTANGGDAESASGASGKAGEDEGVNRGDKKPILIIEFIFLIKFMS